MRIAEVLFLLTLVPNPQSPSETPTPGTIDQANSLRAAGKLSEARDAFEQILASSPGNVAAQDGEVQVTERMALEARSAGRQDEALAVLLRAQRFAPENIRLLLDLGVLEDEMHLYLDADRTITHLEHLSPDDPNVLYAAARIKLDLGQLAPAEEKMQAYLKSRPEDASAHYGLGRIYRQGLQWEKARSEFERSIELQPSQTEAYYQLGDTEFRAKNYSEAIANFGKTLDRNPKHGGALAGTGIAYYREKQYDKAMQFLEAAIQTTPEYQPGHYYLGLTLARLGKTEESERELATATRLADQDNKKAANRLRITNPVPSR